MIKMIWMCTVYVKLLLHKWYECRVCMWVYKYIFRYKNEGRERRWVHEKSNIWIWCILAFHSLLLHLLLWCFLSLLSVSQPKNRCLSVCIPIIITIPLSENSVTMRVRAKLLWSPPPSSSNPSTKHNKLSQTHQQRDFHSVTLLKPCMNES